MMRTQKIAFLTVVDVESFVVAVEKNYYKDLTQIYGFEMSNKDADNLLLYHTINTAFNFLKESENRKNVIFYINTNVGISPRYIKALEKVCKVFPILNYTNSLDFNCLELDSGCCEELSTLIKEYRYNFDFNRFSQRKMKAFLDKYKISLTFPA